MIAKGEFEVSMKPAEFSVSGADGINLGRFMLDKKFHGPLEATSRGEMMAARTATPTSAGYVAIEQVTGTLDGKTGSFVLQHFGIMSGGHNRLTLEVVPDSGAGELVGLKGTMKIVIEAGKHFYDFDFEL
ncbi:DUF3224 domain-containing protein [soil metagenome]